MSRTNRLTQEAYRNKLIRDNWLLSQGKTPAVTVRPNAQSTIIEDSSQGCPKCGKSIEVWADKKRPLACLKSHIRFCKGESSDVIL